MIFKISLILFLLLWGLNKLVSWGRFDQMNNVIAVIAIIAAIALALGK